VKRKMQNPWLQIPSEDYEKHMSHRSVMQLQMLDNIFENVLNELHPNSVAVLGCTAGNGFQHLLNREFEKVVGIDINFSYLAECKAWFVQDIQNLQLICADLNKLEITDKSFDLIHAALIFEYIDVEIVLSKISNWLKPGGVLTVVLQMVCETSTSISETEVESIKLLNTIMKLVKPEEFELRAIKCGLVKTKNYKIKLESGKNFLVMFFQK
jgi:SAM-dependent methyltransferase